MPNRQTTITLTDMEQLGEFISLDFLIADTSGREQKRQLRHYRKFCIKTENNPSTPQDYNEYHRWCVEIDFPFDEQIRSLDWARIANDIEDEEQKEQTIAKREELLIKPQNLTK